MPTSYTRKSPQQLAWDDNRDYVRIQVDLALRKLRRELLNAAIADASDDFNQGLQQDEVRRLGPTTEEVVRMVAGAARRLALETGVDER